MTKVWMERSAESVNENFEKVWKCLLLNTPSIHLNEENFLENKWKMMSCCNSMCKNITLWKHREKWSLEEKYCVMSQALLHALQPCHMHDSISQMLSYRTIVTVITRVKYNRNDIDCIEKFTSVFILKLTVHHVSVQCSSSILFMTFKPSVHSVTHLLCSGGFAGCSHYQHISGRMRRGTSCTGCQVCRRASTCRWWHLWTVGKSWNVWNESTV